MKRIIIVSKQGDLRLLAHELNGKEKVIALGDELLQDNAMQKAIAKPVAAYIKKNLEAEAVAWFKAWSKKKIAGKNFKEWMAYGTTSVWWFMDEWLYFAYVYYDSVKQVLLNAMKIHAVLDAEKPSYVLFVQDSSLAARMLEHICVARHIPFTAIRTGQASYAWSRLKKGMMMQALRQLLFLKPIVRKGYWSSLKRKEQEQTVRNAIFLIANEGTWTSNSTLRYVHDELSKKKSNHPYLIDVSRKASFELATLKKKSAEPFNHLLFEEYLDAEARKKSGAEIRKLRRIWKKLSSMPAFARSFDFQGLSLWPFVKDQFNCYLSTRMPDHVRSYEGVRSMLAKNKPAAVFVPTITGPFERAVFAAGKELSIPVVNIEPGIISENYLGYLHTADEIAEEDGPLHCPIPSVIAVYGDYDKEFMIEKGKFPESHVAVTGEPRYDALAQAHNVFNRRKTCRFFRINPHKKIVLLATQPFDRPNEKEIILQETCRAIKTMKNAELVIKLHPGEQDNAIHRAIAKEEGVSAVIVRDANIHELIYACDVLIVAYSTVGLEAMILNKPVIEINIGRKNSEFFVPSGAAVGVYKKNELAQVLHQVLEDRGLQEKLLQKRKAFVFKRCYKIDGNAGRRVAEVIERRLVKHG